MDPKAALERFIRFVMRDTVYLSTYVATVQGQGSDDTVDVLPDDERVRGAGLSNVPIRHGLPGIRVRVAVGARVLLSFDGGDPRKPYVAIWEPGSVELVVFDNGVQAMARQGDLVQSGGPGTLVTLWPVTGTPAPPNGAVVAGIPHLISFDVLPPTPVTAAPLYGVVATGKQEWKA